MSPATAYLTRVNHQPPSPPIHIDWGELPPASPRRSVLIQTALHPDLKAQATAVLDKLNLTLDDVVRVLMARIAHDGALPFAIYEDPVAYRAYYMGRVLEADEDPRPLIPHERVEAEFAAYRAELLAKISNEQ